MMDPTQEWVMKEIDNALFMLRALKEINLVDKREYHNFFKSIF